MVGCSIYGCKSRSEWREPGLSFYSFPKDDLFKKNWIMASGRGNWHPTVHARICSSHFLDSDYVIKNGQKLKKLKCNAVPSINIPGSNLVTTDVDRIEQPSTSTSNTTSVMEFETSKTTSAIKTKLPMEAQNYPELKKLRTFQTFYSSRSAPVPMMDSPSESLDGKMECRLCFQVFDHETKMINLLKQWPDKWDGMEELVVDDLNKLTNIDVSKADVYSKDICLNCYIRLKDACTFVCFVSRNDTMLKNKSYNSDDNDNGLVLRPIGLAKEVSTEFIKPTMEIKEENSTDVESVTDEYKTDLDIKIEPEEMNTCNGNSLNTHKTYGASKKYTTVDFLDTMKDEPRTESGNLECEECLLCSKIFRSISGLKAHVLAQHSYQTVKRKLSTSEQDNAKVVKMNYLCETCKRSFATSTDLMVHMTCHNKDMCFKCNEKFDNFDELAKHTEECNQKNGDGNDNIKLLYLDDIKRDLLNSVEEDSDGTPDFNLNCDQCTEKFTDLYYLNIHKEIQHKTEQSSPFTASDKMDINEKSLPSLEALGDIFDNDK